MSSFKRDTRVRLEADASFGAKGLLGTVMNKPYPKDHFRRVWWDDGTINTVPVSLLEQVTPMEELALVHKAKKNSPKYPKFKVNDYAQVRWVQNDRQRTVIGRVVSIEGNDVVFYAPELGAVNLRRADLEELSPLEQLSRVKTNPVIKYLRGKDAEGVRAGVKNSLQFLNSRLMHLRSLIEAHDCGSLQADEEYDQTWDDIWHGVRDLTKR